MKQLLVTLLCSTLSFASINNINSFKADFIQSVTDDNNSTLSYKGNVIAKKPQNALWSYIKPIKKNVYIDESSVTIVEPEIEQVIIKRIESNFDFFMMIKNAIKINNNTYEASYKDAKFIITTRDDLIKSISYKDEFDNKVNILFKNQKQNIDVEDKLFIPNYPLNFDIIRD